MKNKKKNKATQLIDESGKDFILDGKVKEIEHCFLLNLKFTFKVSFNYL